VEHEPLAELEQKRDLRRNTREWRRVQAIVLARQGRPATEIASVLGCTSRAVQGWVTLYNNYGTEGLLESPRSGRPPKITPEMEKRLRKYLDGELKTDPTQAKLRGVDISQWLLRECGVSYSLNGVYALLHRLGYGALLVRLRSGQPDADANSRRK